jgi:hypothetical protein
MEPEGSLPCSQEPSTGPYHEPDRSSIYHPIHLRLGLPSDLLFLTYLQSPIFWPRRTKQRYKVTIPCSNKWKHAAAT